MRIRPIIALSAVALTGVLLTGCTGSSDPAATPSSSASGAADLCAAAVNSGAASDAVTVSGDIGAEPKVEFTAPLDITAVERTVTTEGNGDRITNGDWVDFGAVAYDAQTGTRLVARGFDAGTSLPLQVSADGSGQVFGCATVGTRIVVVSPGSEQGTGQITVFDVTGIAPTVAWGEPQPAVDGMPTVELAEDGTPTITIPDAAAPTELEIHDLKKGDGITVAQGDTVFVQYTGVSWDTKKNFDSSWGRGAPTQFNTEQVYAGFGKALVGQKVGSQVIVVMPPDMGALNGDLKGQTLVFVIDILATQHTTTG